MDELGPGGQKIIDAGAFFIRCAGVSLIIAFGLDGLGTLLSAATSSADTLLVAITIIAMYAITTIAMYAIHRFSRS